MWVIQFGCSNWTPLEFDVSNFHLIGQSRAVNPMHFKIEPCFFSLLQVEDWL